MGSSALLWGDFPWNQYKEACQVKPAHGQLSCIQQLCKDINHGLSLSEEDWGDLKRETTKHEPSLMEVDWGEKLSPNTHQVDAASWKLTGRNT